MWLTSDLTAPATPHLFAETFVNCMLPMFQSLGSTHTHEIFHAPRHPCDEHVISHVEPLPQPLLRPSFLREMSYLLDPAISHAGRRKAWGGRSSPHYGWLALEIEFED